jgi:hypothetical protein
MIRTYKVDDRDPKEIARAIMRLTGWLAQATPMREDERTYHNAITAGVKAAQTRKRNDIKRSQAAKKAWATRRQRTRAA